MVSLTKKCFAEAIGTFVLVFFSVGTAMVTGSVIAIALAFGLSIMAMVYTIGDISGCHINPAVSVAMLFLNKMKLKDCLFYILAQVVGAILASLALYSIVGMSVNQVVSFGTNALIGGEYSFGAVIGSFLFELIITFFFVYIVLKAAIDNKFGKLGGVAIGLALVLVHLIGIGFTGTSVNPARSIGPAIMSLVFGGGAKALSFVWLFIVAPIGGGIVAAFVFKLAHTKYSEEELAEMKAKQDAEIAEEKAKKAAKKEAKEESKIKSVKSKKGKASKNAKPEVKKNSFVDDEEEVDEDEEYEDEDEDEEEDENEKDE